MEHVGLDLGALHTHVVVMDAQAELKKRTKVRTEQLAEWLRKQPTCRVVMEACTQSPAIARAALASHHETVIVPGQVVRALGVGARGIKTDDRDAEVLARASVRNEHLPSVHLRSEESTAMRELIAARALLLKSRTTITLSVKSWMRGQLIGIKGRATSNAFSDAVRSTLLKRGEGMPSTIAMLLETYDHLCGQIDKLDEQVKEMAAHDATCQLLMTVPGVGPCVSLAFRSHLDDPTRFESSSKLASYLALVPGENTTGGKIHRTGMIKAGPTYLKALLVQSAWAAWRSRPNEPMVLWARAIAGKRGRRIAIIALARKLGVVMWSMWKNRTKYDPSKASTVRATSASEVSQPS